MTPTLKLSKRLQESIRAEADRYGMSFETMARVRFAFVQKADFTRFSDTSTLR